MFEVSFIPAFKDNYIWLLTRGKRAFVVDPGDSAPVCQRLETDGLTLEGILITHHHADHQGGIAELKGRWQTEVYAPANESITGCTRPLSGGERNRVHLACMLKEGANVLLLDEPTNDLDVNTMRALEDALENFSGCVLVISHDRWFLDRIATHILAFEGDSKVVWFEGNYSDYEADRKKRLGVAADQPHRIKYRHLTRA